MIRSPGRINSTIKKSGQINAFFRWKDVRDTPETIETSLFLVKPAELKTTFTIPAEATADVSLRRLQMLRVAPGAMVRWTFGTSEGEVRADATGMHHDPAAEDHRGTDHPEHQGSEIGMVSSTCRSSPSLRQFRIFRRRTTVNGSPTPADRIAPEGTGSPSAWRSGLGRAELTI